MAEARGPQYCDYEEACRQHYKEHYESEEFPYERYELAYTFGFDIGKVEPYVDRKWQEIEEEVRKDWLEEGAGAWEDFKEAVQHGWQTAKDAVSGQR